MIKLEIVYIWYFLDIGSRHFLKIIKENGSTGALILFSVLYLVGTKSLGE